MSKREGRNTAGRSRGALLAMRLVGCAAILLWQGRLLAMPPRGSGAAYAATPVWAPAHLALGFIVNQGQTDSRVRFLAHQGPTTLFLTGTDAVIRLVRGTGVRPAPTGFPGHVEPARPLQSAVLRLHPHGANPHPTIRGVRRLPGYANFFIGRDPKRWRTHVPAYAEVEYLNVYPGIDLVYRMGGGEYDWVVHPGARPDRISMAVSGANGLSIDRSGALVVRTSAGALVQPLPRVYQDVNGVRLMVPGGYVLTGGNRVGLRLGSFDRRRTLVVDPALRYSTLLGGSVDNQGLGIAVDGQGSAYITGDTGSNTFPADHAIQSRNAGQTDAFVLKLNPGGTAPVYSTYLGGADGDTGIGIAVDAQGRATMTGETYSSDFPTANALQAENRSQCRDLSDNLVPCPDAFVTRLDASGSKLVYSTYLGGDGMDTGNAVAVAPDGSTVVTGQTDSDTFPVVSALQRTRRSTLCLDDGGMEVSCDDAFVARLSPAGTHLIYSTYLGGGREDVGHGVAVDSSGDAYVTGVTSSRDFPTANAIQPHNGGISNGFVLKLSANGRTLIYSTYLGGSSIDTPTNIAVDRAGSAYVTGLARSTNFPVAHALQATKATGPCDPDPNSTGSCVDAFVTKLTPEGNALAYSTYLGGGRDDEALGIAVDPAGDAYIAGDTSSTDFPVLHAYQSRNAGSSDAIVSELNSAGNRLVYSTYVGGRRDDFANAIAVGSAGNAYVTGSTDSSSFPVTGSGKGGSGTDLFVLELGNQPETSARRGTSAAPRTCMKGYTLVHGRCRKNHRAT